MSSLYLVYSISLNLLEFCWLCLHSLTTAKVRCWWPVIALQSVTSFMFGSLMFGTEVYLWLLNWSVLIWSDYVMAVFVSFYNFSGKYFIWHQCNYSFLVSMSIECFSWRQYIITSFAFFFFYKFCFLIREVNLSTFKIIMLSKDLLLYLELPSCLCILLSTILFLR